MFSFEGVFVLKLACDVKQYGAIVKNFVTSIPSLSLKYLSKPLSKKYKCMQVLPSFRINSFFEISLLLKQLEISIQSLLGINWYFSTKFLNDFNTIIIYLRTRQIMASFWVYTKYNI